jgi:hypothetical protein
LGNKVISLSEVSGSSLMITPEMQEDRLKFEVFSLASDKKQKAAERAKFPRCTTIPWECIKKRYSESKRVFSFRFNFFQFMSPCGIGPTAVDIIARKKKHNLSRYFQGIFVFKNRPVHFAEFGMIAKCRL